MIYAVLLFAIAWGESILITAGIKYMFGIPTAACLFIVVVSTTVGLFLASVFDDNDSHCICSDCQPLIPATFISLFISTAVSLMFVFHWALALGGII